MSMVSVISMYFIITNIGWVEFGFHPQVVTPDAKGRYHPSIRIGFPRFLRPSAAVDMFALHNLPGKYVCLSIHNKCFLIEFMEILVLVSSACFHRWEGHATAISYIANVVTRELPVLVSHCLIKGPVSFVQPHHREVSDAKKGFLEFLTSLKLRRKTFECTEY